MLVATPPAYPQMLYVDPSTEAFAVFVFANNRTRWLKQFQVAQENPGKTLTVITKRPSHVKAPDQVIEDGNPKVDEKGDPVYEEEEDHVSPFVALFSCCHCPGFQHCFPLV